MQRNTLTLAVSLLVGLVACDGKGVIEDTGAEFAAGNETGIPSYDWASDTSTPDLTATDSDGDGTPDAYDCDPDDAEIHPGAEEVAYDGVDNDCDESTRDDDLDGDGYGVDDDCDDLDPTVYGDDCDEGFEPGEHIDRSAGIGDDVGGSVGEGSEDDESDLDDDADLDHEGWDTGWESAADKLSGDVELTGGACGCSAEATAGGGFAWMLALCAGFLRRGRSRERA